jgi:ubiquinone/menaquinone biosynthesis C-methylase UbiE/DNA-binding transcriptional ArsR family regulator
MVASVASRETGRPDALLGWMASLADPTRLRILRLLERRELGVADLCHALGLPQSTVSGHLKVLADEGWVEGRAQGTTRLYRQTAGEADPAARKLWLLARDQTEGWPAVEQDRLRLDRRLAERDTGAAEFFAGAADKWDDLRAQLYGRAFTQAALLSLLPQDAVIADLGCGTGHAAAVLSPFVGQVIGVDQSAAMLKAAQRRTRGLQNVQLRKGALEALPIEDASVDGALLVLALCYVEHAAPVLREVTRVLRPGGRAVVVDLLRHDRDDFRRQLGQTTLGLEPVELKELMEGAGLAGVRVRAMPPEEGAKGPALVLAAGGRAANDVREGRSKR